MTLLCPNVGVGHGVLLLSECLAINFTLFSFVSAAKFDAVVVLIHPSHVPMNCEYDVIIFDPQVDLQTNLDTNFWVEQSSKSPTVRFVQFVCPEGVVL